VVARPVPPRQHDDGRPRSAVMGPVVHGDRPHEVDAAREGRPVRCAPKREGLRALSRRRAVRCCKESNAAG